MYRLISILSILPLSLQWVLKKTNTNFLRYTGYRNFINDLIKRISLQILVHVRLLLLTSGLTAVKNIGLDTMILFTKGAELTIFGSIKNSNDVLNKFKSKIFKAAKLFAYDFSTLYSTIPHHLIKETY